MIDFQPLQEEESPTPAIDFLPEKEEEASPIDFKPSNISEPTYDFAKVGPIPDSNEDTKKFATNFYTPSSDSKTTEEKISDISSQLDSDKPIVPMAENPKSQEEMRQEQFYAREKLMEDKMEEERLNNKTFGEHVKSALGEAATQTIEFIPQVTSGKAIYDLAELPFKAVDEVMPSANESGKNIVSQAFDKFREKTELNNSDLESAQIRQGLSDAGVPQAETPGEKIAGTGIAMGLGMVGPAMGAKALSSAERALVGADRAVTPVIENTPKLNTYVAPEAPKTNPFTEALAQKESTYPKYSLNPPQRDRLAKQSLDDLLHVSPVTLDNVEDYYNANKAVLSNDPAAMAVIGQRELYAGYEKEIKTAADLEQSREISHIGAVSDKFKELQRLTRLRAKGVGEDLGGLSTVEKSPVAKIENMTAMSPVYRESLISGIEDIAEARPATKTSFWKDQSSGVPLETSKANTYTTKPIRNMDTLQIEYVIDKSVKPWGQILKDVKATGDKGSRKFLIGPKRYGDTLKEFGNYLRARRATDIFTRLAAGEKIAGAENGYRGFKSLEEAQAAVNKYAGTDFEKLALDTHKLAHRLLDDLEVAGIFSRQQIDRMKAKNPNYIPYLDELREEGVPQAVLDELATSDRSLNFSVPVRDIRASNDLGENPLAAMEKYIRMTSTAGSNMLAKNAIFAETLNLPAAEFARIYGYPKDKVLDKLHNLKGKTGKVLDLTSDIDHNKSISLRIGGNTIKVTPLDEKWFALMTRGLDRSPVANTPLFTPIKRAISFNATSGPFALGIFIKEGWDLPVYAPKGTTVLPLSNIGNAIKYGATNKFATNPELRGLWEEFQTSNPFQAHRMRDNLEKIPNVSDLVKAYDEGTIAESSIPKAAWDGFVSKLANLDMFYDDINRFTIYKAARKAGYSADEARVFARKTGPDWSQSGYGYAKGTTGQALYTIGQNMPFFLTGIKTIDRNIMLAKYDTQQWGRGLAQSYIAYQLMEAPISYLTMDEKGRTAFDRMTEQARMRNIPIPIGKSDALNEMLYIGKGYVTGPLEVTADKAFEMFRKYADLNLDNEVKSAFNTILPKYMELTPVQSQKAKKALQEYYDRNGINSVGLLKTGIVSLINPNTLPTNLPGISTAFGLMTNVNPATGATISRSQDNIGAYAGMTDKDSSTHPLAVHLSNAVGTGTPRQWEYALNSTFYFGLFKLAGDFGTWAVAKAEGNEMPSSFMLQNTPWTRGMGQNREFTKDIQRFYNMAYQVKYITNTQNELYTKVNEGQLDPSVADGFYRNTATIQALSSEFTKAHQKIKKLDRQSVEIFNNKSLTSDQKDARIKALGAQMNEVANNVVSMYYNYVPEDVANATINSLISPTPVFGTAVERAMINKKLTKENLPDVKDTNPTKLPDVELPVTPRGTMSGDINKGATP